METRLITNDQQLRRYLPNAFATVNIDRTGTTVIGKYLLNHSFMMPGMVHTVVACVAGYLIAFLYHSMGWI